MDFRIERSDSDVLVTLDGRLTFGENAAFRRMIEALGHDTDRKVVFDLGGMDHIDSAGLGMLMVAREAVVNGGGTAGIANAHGQVERMLALARFGDFFTLG